MTTTIQQTPTTPGDASALSESNPEGNGASTPTALLQPQAHHRMLDLPSRGDRLAAVWLGAGVAAYLLLAAVLAFTLPDERGSGAGILTLLGLTEPINWTVVVLVVTGILLFVGTVLTIARDIRAMAAEERDIEWVRTKKREGLNLVFADPSEREKLFRQGMRATPSTGTAVETLTDDRVRRVQRALHNGRYAGVSVEELRVIAEQRTARLGSFARFTSSLLLLLAVLGTFAGVKTALPALIQAMGPVSGAAAATAAGQGASVALPSLGQLQAPLQALSGAFGSNALALIGAIAVGLMAQGVSFGRRHMLERLELVSAEYIYGDETASSADPLQAAVHALNRTATELHAASGTMVGIQEGIQSLGTQFESSLGELTSKLEELVRRQEEGLYDRTGATLEALQKRVGQLAQVVQENAVTYQGLVDSLRARTEESRASIDQMRQSNEQLAKGLDAFLEVGKRAERTFEKADQTFGAADQQFRVMESAATRIADAQDETAKQVGAIAAVIGSLDTLLRSDGRDETTKQLAALRETLDALNTRLTGIDETNRAVMRHLEQGDARTAEALTTFSRDLGAKMDTLGAHLETSRERHTPGPVPSASGMQDREIVTLLRRITEQNEAARTTVSFRQQLALQIVPVSVSAMAGAGLTLSFLRWFAR